MSKLFDDLKESISDMAKHARGEPVKGISLHTVSIKPVPNTDAKDIRRIRTYLGISQGAFAAILGVSKKAVEAWEAGINKPAKPVLRLLQLFAIRKNLLSEFLGEITGKKTKIGISLK